MINLRIKHGSTGCRWKFQEDNKCSVTEDPTLTKSGRSCRFLWPKVTLGQRNICLLLPELCLVKSHLAPVNENMNFGLTIKNSNEQHSHHANEYRILLDDIQAFFFSPIGFFLNIQKLLEFDTVCKLDGGCWQHDINFFCTLTLNSSRNSSPLPFDKNDNEGPLGIQKTINFVINK